MRQHADESHPRVNLLIGQFAANVADGHDAHGAAAERGVGLMHGKSFELVLHLVDVGYGLTPEQLQGGCVAAQYQSAALVDNENTGIDRIEDELKVFLLFYLFVTRVLQDFLHPIERGVDGFVVAPLSPFVEAESVVAIVERIEEKLYLFHVAAVATHEYGHNHYKNDDENRENDRQHDYNPYFLILL